MMITSDIATNTNVKQDTMTLVKQYTQIGDTDGIRFKKRY